LVCFIKLKRLIWLGTQLTGPGIQKDTSLLKGGQVTSRATAEVVPQDRVVASGRSRGHLALACMAVPADCLWLPVDWVTWAISVCALAWRLSVFVCLLALSCESPMQDGVGMWTQLLENGDLTCLLISGSRQHKHKNANPHKPSISYGHFYPEK
jgi:hypothetical protein